MTFRYARIPVTSSTTAVTRCNLEGEARGTVSEESPERIFEE
jgi:hypothetical protein